MFRTFNRQWKYGFNGPVALDLGVFQHALDRKGITGEQYDEFIYSLTVIESAALKEIHKS